MNTMSLSDYYFFFFSSRRRHTRCSRDWSSDVCSSDLVIGDPGGLDESYLDRLDALARRFQPAWISDHLCWTGVNGRQTHDLLPLPYTEQALDHVVGRVLRVQERLGRPIALENVSSYVAYRHSAMPEWEFLAEVARRSGCGILLDINNIFVSSRNHGFDPRTYLNHIPPATVWQFHLAGHSNKGTHLLDTHDHAVIDEVWGLYRGAVARFGAVSSLIEWDDRIPPFERLENESQRARAIHDETLERSAGRRPARVAGSPRAARAGGGPWNPGARTRRAQARGRF